MTVEPMWHIVDARTGKRVAVAAYATQQQAEAQIERWRERDRRAGRLVPYLAAQCEGDH